MKKINFYLFTLASKYILINLFAGIAKADLIAEGIVEANNELNNN